MSYQIEDSMLSYGCTSDPEPLEAYKPANLTGALSSSPYIVGLFCTLLLGRPLCSYMLNPWEKKDQSHSDTINLSQCV
jgi:hypothetical protein